MTYDIFKKELETTLNLRTKNDIVLIRKIIQDENLRREKKGIDIIDNVRDYNCFAKENNIETYDKLIDKHENIDLFWFLAIDMRRYVSWEELKKICSAVKRKNSDMDEKIYAKLRSQNNLIPKNPSIIYFKTFINLDNLFGSKNQTDYDNL